MRSQIKILLASGVLSLIFILAEGCSGSPWPHRSFTLDLSRAHASREQIAEVATTYLKSHGLEDAGKAGQDAINNTSSVLNFRGSDGLLVSIYLNRKDVVPVSFDQDRPHFSKNSDKLFDDFVAFLESNWPGAVIPDSSGKKGA